MYNIEGYIRNTLSYSDRGTFTLNVADVSREFEKNSFIEARALSYQGSYNRGSTV